MINGITFSEQMFTSADFAHFMYTFLNHANGITKGCEISNADGNVYIQKGYFMQCGRMVRIIGTEEIPSPEVVSGQLYCKVVFEIDLTKSNTIEEFNQGYFRTLTGTAAYPEMTQEDLDNDGTLHQIPWCQYIKTAEGISEFEDIREVIDATSVWELYEDLNAHISDKNNPHGIKAGDIGAMAASNGKAKTPTLEWTDSEGNVITFRTGGSAGNEWYGFAVSKPDGTIQYLNTIVRSSGGYKRAVNAIYEGGTGAADRASGIYNLLFIGVNPITSASDDTVANWIAKGNGYCFYSTANMITDQPSRYGILINYTYGSEVFQLWHCQPTGPLYIRAGNSSGWNHSWRKIFDNSQTIPVANGGTGVKTLASGAVLIGNGTGAVQTRPITNNTTGASASGTNIPTCNTLNHHVQFWLNRGASVHQANTGYTTYMARGIALLTAVPSSMTNGTVAFIYQ